ncbi:monovalent cation/H+ antiporter complex subunit F [Ancylobacter sp. WKF20]|uniref:monovalent cation/H+ antiporter complex subunit F n=1 Tax=Ancylobacter sp. WKF20 TaxID=3039801 RepID=UPI0024343ED3|nr:monovalent cation/H+ antiporter complex subunit F [Ancylobacter sp. WKF20]WGD31017.1 monovalent cation/H+ antiporter complex subunit F [Ancylobacter sp. WKF20]
MAELLNLAALLLLLLMATGLVWLLRAPSAADRLMAVQLAGTGGTAVLALLAIAEGVAALLDVALTLALVAAFASAALFAAGPASPPDERREPS